MTFGVPWGDLSGIGPQEKLEMGEAATVQKSSDRLEWWWRT